MYFTYYILRSIIIIIFCTITDEPKHFYQMTIRKLCPLNCEHVQQNIRIWIFCFVVSETDGDSIILTVFEKYVLKKWLPLDNCCNFPVRFEAGILLVSVCMFHNRNGSYSTALAKRVVWTKNKLRLVVHCHHLGCGRHHGC